MTYYLETLTNFLTTNRYTDVFYDYDNPTVEERIFLQNTGGPVTEANTPVLQRDFSLYIRRNKKATARTVANAIYLLLAGNERTLQGILKIQVTPPQVFTVDTNANIEYIINGSCLCVDNSQNRIF